MSSTPSIPTSTPQPPPSTSNSGSNSYCFHIPNLPYVRKVTAVDSKGNVVNTEASNTSDIHSAPANPVICYTQQQLSDDHLSTVKKICSIYAQCNRMICKDFTQTGQTGQNVHGVMCPTQDHYENSCLYEWAKLGISSSQEIDFVTKGQTMIDANPQTVEQCRNIIVTAAKNPTISKLEHL